MLVTRPANASDLDALIRLAKKAGPGFTSLAIGEAALEAKLHKSIRTFTKDKERKPNQNYLLMVEDLESNTVVGLSGIKALIGEQDPYFNFRILNIAQKSAVTDKRFDMEVLLLVNEYAGATEVGSLFVDESMRGTGAGRLISQSRYMLMAAAPGRFGNRVVSELRGRVDIDGNSPFWDAIGKKFFHMSFSEADRISAEKDNQFILDLMPKYPIYAELLPQEARDVMGVTHPAGTGARRYLESEGFRYDGVIDIFDGGPVVSAPMADIRTVSDSRVLTVIEGDVNDKSLTALISNDEFENFRSVLQQVRFDGDNLIVSRNALNVLNLKSAETARVWIKR